MRPAALMSALRARRQALFAWASLGVGLASAVLMDRSPGRAWIVIVAVVVGWLGVFAFAIVDRTASTSRGAWRLVRIGSRLAALGPVQFALFFTLPFYLRAHAGLFVHTLFVGVLIAAALVTLWDPWHEALARHPVRGMVLQGIGTFAAVNAMLPIVGIANGTSLWCAVVAAFVIVPFATVMALPVGERRSFVLRMAPRLFIVSCLFLLPPVRRMVPAAPLRLLDTRIGTGIANLEVQGASDVIIGASELACYSVVWAPAGLREPLVHIWSKDGQVLDRIPVQVRGGREAGFRTWSQKRNLGAAPHGAWSCAVETAAGQSLGHERVTLR